MSTGRHHFRLSLAQRLAAVAIVLIAAAVPVFGLVFGSGEAAAAPSFSNAKIADLAARNVRGHGGECFQFAANMIRQAGGRDIRTSTSNPDYFVHLQAAGGTRITTLDGLRKGDVVQEGQGVHTFIIERRVSPNVFTIIDSNHDYRGTVMRYNRKVTLDNTHRAYRFGRV